MKSSQEVLLLREFATGRIKDVAPSGTLALAEKAGEMKANGIDVISFGVGEPDFDTPETIISKAKDALDRGLTHYVASRGIPELRRSITEKLKAENRLDYNPNTDIIVTPSGKFAIFAVIMATIGPGDEVVIPDPSWVSYDPCVIFASGKAVHVSLSSDDNFLVTKEKLRSALTPRTKAIIINSPNNPTGRVFTLPEIEAVAAFAKENDLLVISDEIYEKIIYDENVHISIASLPGMKERTVVVNGFSKTFSMTGWRLGYIACEKGLASQILKLQQHSVTCATSFAQAGAVGAFTGAKKELREMVDEFKARRDLIVDGLNSVTGISCPVPEGAFYAFPNVSRLGRSSMELSEYLLNEAHVGVTPGIEFGKCGEGHIRISYATSRDNIRKGLDRIKKALS